MTLDTVELTRFSVFGETEPAEPFLRYTVTPGEVSYFVGRNGSGKSKTARAIREALQGTYLSTDRLIGIMSVANNGWGAVPGEYRGAPLGKEERSSIDWTSRIHGVGTEHLLMLRDHPVVGLKVAAFLRRVLGRVIVPRESAGFFDPHVRVGGVEYSLLRDEGHGLRELTILLAAVYDDRWSVLVVDEPELHLHPALAQIWAAELGRECRERGAHAIVVTHEPTLVRPKTIDDLKHVWFFSPGGPPATVRQAIYPGSEQRVIASLLQNPQIVSQIAFAPRPVLVEGVHDVAAIGAALARTQPPAVTSQTELVSCGSSGEAVMWFEIARQLDLNVRCVADLDALFSPDVHRTIDRSINVVDALRRQFMADPPRTHTVIKPLIDAANAAGIGANEKARARWLANEVEPESGLEERRDRLLAVLKTEGLWLHPEGTLEDVLGIIKGQAQPAAAASKPGSIDRVAAWCAYDLDPLGDMLHLLRANVERIANEITQALGVDAEAIISTPVGAMSESDSKLVDVGRIGDQMYRITVKTPHEFAGYFADFDRNTPPSQITLNPPTTPLEHLGGGL